ncbi:MAG TPA: hypothetical protein VHP31_12180 [Caproicibacter sp.]|nr:hypothetical protein [Caproicibacter sp.]
MPDIIQQIREALAAGENADILHTLLPELLKSADDGKIVELPCKVGDTVYHIDTGNHIWEFIIVEIHGATAEVESKDSLKAKASFDVLDMPKPRLFFTREAAEKALGERDNS